MGFIRVKTANFATRRLDNTLLNVDNISFVREITLESNGVTWCRVYLKPLGESIYLLGKMATLRTAIANAVEVSTDEEERLSKIFCS
jgi:hypothetical protein